jgi:hypothetical protein
MVGMRCIMLFKLISNVKIISKMTQKEECIVKSCEISFHPYKDFSCVKEGMSKIEFKLDNYTFINLSNLEIEKIDFNYNNIDHLNPYTVDFDALIEINNTLHLYKGFFERVLLNHKYGTLNETNTLIKLKSAGQSRLFLNERVQE